MPHLVCHTIHLLLDSCLCRVTSQGKAIQSVWNTIPTVYIIVYIFKNDYQ